MAIIHIYEVEHSGDELEALYELEDIGCKNIRVIDRDYEGGEQITVVADPPEGKNLMAFIIERDLCMDVVEQCPHGAKPGPCYLC